MIEEEPIGVPLCMRAAEFVACGTPTKRALGIDSQRKHARRNHVAEMEWGGRTVPDNDSIAPAFRDHYQTLFAQREVNVARFKEQFSVAFPRVDEEGKTRLERPISEPEVERTIDKLNAGKSPGPTFRVLQNIQGRLSTIISCSVQIGL